MKLLFNISGMSCAACAAHIENAVKKVPGVSDVSVNLISNSMNVEGEYNTNDIINAVHNSGYDAYLNTSDNVSIKTNIEENTTNLKTRLIFSIIFLLPLLYISFGVVMWNFPFPPFLSNQFFYSTLELVFCSVIIIINRFYFISGIKSLFKLSPNMNTLVCIGSGSAYIYSLVLYILQFTQYNYPSDFIKNIYFDSAGMILTIITIGKLLECIAKGKTTNALQNLINLSPKTACILIDDKEIIIPATQLNKEDTFIVKPGDTIPADGTVLQGNSTVNESMLTGESLPVNKAEKDSVNAATVNISGYLICKATNVGKDTDYEKIIRLVEESSLTKAPIARIADNISKWFVPCVLIIALLSTAIWLLTNHSIGFSLERGISVLVISCPCALGLATPMAIMVGNGIGAKNGILFKTSEALENLGKINNIALDKTGTITNAAPIVTDYSVINNFTEKDIFPYLFCIESKSNHPIAKALLKFAEKYKDPTLNILNFVSVPGNGLSGKINNHIIAVGNRDFMINQSVTDNNLFSIDQTSSTTVFFSIDNVLCSIYHISDPLKNDCKEAITQIKNMGISPVMLTGDNEKTATSIAKQANISDYKANLKPNEKNAIIKELLSTGKTAMVGDGINDAPALTTSDIGIAMGNGTDVAIQSASVILLKNELCTLPAAIRLSRIVIKNIKENLFWALCYNLFGIPLAAGLWYPLFDIKMSPIFGSVSMCISSLIVVGNALRLNLFNIYNPSHDYKIKNKTRRNTMTKTIFVEGMMCSHCEATVKDTLEKIDGIISANADHNSGTVTLSLSKDVPDKDIISAIEAKGYKAKI